MRRNDMTRLGGIPTWPRRRMSEAPFAVGNLSPELVQWIAYFKPSNWFTSFGLIHFMVILILLPHRFYCRHLGNDNVFSCFALPVDSGVATGEWVGPDPPLLTPPEISANPLKSFFIYLYGGYPMHVYWNFYCSPAKKYGSDSLTFLGWRHHCRLLISSFDGNRNYRVVGLRVVPVGGTPINLTLAVFRIKCAMMVICAVVVYYVNRW